MEGGGGGGGGGGGYSCRPGWMFPSLVCRYRPLMGGVLVVIHGKKSLYTANRTV